MMNRDEIESLKEHGRRNVTRILDKLGVAYRQNYMLLQAQCPCKQHEGDGSNQNAFSWKDDIGHWVCWSHHCEEMYGSDVIGLIRSILEVDFVDAIKWLDKTLGDHQSSGLVTAKRTSRRTKLLQPLDEMRLKFLQPNPQYLINRGFSESIMRRYEVGLWSRLGTFMHNRVVFPIRDLDGYLVGFSGRTIYKEEDWSKYQIKAKWTHGRYFDQWPRENEFSVGTILYNFFHSKTYKKLIVVEGILDGLRLSEANIENWIAIFGTNLTANQRNLLVNAGVNELTLAFDPDKAGDTASNKIKKQLEDLFHIKQVKLPNDPAELQLSTLREIFQ